MLLAAAALIQDSARTEFRVDGETITAPLFRRFSGERVSATPVAIENLGDAPLDALVSTTGIPLVPEPAGGDGFKIVRNYFTPDGEETDLAAVEPERPLCRGADRHRRTAGGHIMVVDPIPAGFEIENPNISLSGEHDELRLAQHRPGFAHRSAYRSLHGGARPRRQLIAGVQRRLLDARGFAGHIRPAGGDGRRHVPAGTLRAHGDGHGRGRRADALEG